MKLARVALYTTLLFASVTLALASRANESSFVWANKPTTASYAPDSRYSHNEAGFTNTVRRLSAGRYVVEMPLAGTPNHAGNVQVSAYGGNHHCKVSSWYKTANVDVKVNVRCHNEYSVLTDGKFTVVYHDAVPDGEDLAFAYISNANPGSYGTIPPGYYRHNLGLPDSTLSNFWYWRESTGVYHVYATDVDHNNRNWTVTAKGQELSHCNLGNEEKETTKGPHRIWINRDHAIVRCFDTLGRRTDSRFTIALTKERGLGSTSDIAAYMHMDRPTASSAVGATYGTWNSESTTKASSTRVGTGTYKVVFWNTGGRYWKSTTLVTAESSSGDYCNVMGWRDVWTMTEVTVKCFAAGGSARDTQFHLSFLGVD